MCRQPYGAPKSLLITLEVRYSAHGFTRRQFHSGILPTNRIPNYINLFITLDSCHHWRRIVLKIISSLSFLFWEKCLEEQMRLSSSIHFMVDFLLFHRDSIRKKCPSTKGNGDKGVQPFWKCHLAPSGKGKKEGLSFCLDSAYGFTHPEGMKRMSLNTG